MKPKILLKRLITPLLFLVCAVSAIPVMAQTIINVKDLGSDGITLIPSTSPDFNTKVTALIGTPSGIVASLMPYSVVLTNSTARTIRGYALRWKGYDAEGNPTYSNLQIEQNFDTRVPGYELPPGRSRALSPVAPLDVPPPRLPAEMNKVAAQHSLTVTVDAIAFDNGQVIGPNEGFAVNVWGQMYAAQRDIGQSVLNKQAQGVSASEVVAWVNQQGPIKQLAVPASSIQESLTGPAHWYKVYANMALNTLIHAGNASPDKMFAAAQLLAQTPVPVLSH